MNTRKTKNFRQKYSLPIMIIATVVIFFVACIIINHRETYRQPDGTLSAFATTNDTASDIYENSLSTDELISENISTEKDFTENNTSEITTETTKSESAAPAILWLQKYAAVGEKLCVTLTGSEKASSYRWYRDDKLIDDISGPEYLITENDLEHFLWAEALNSEGKVIVSMNNGTSTTENNDIAINNQTTNAENDVNSGDESNVSDGRIYCSRLPVLYIDTEDNSPITSKTTYLNAHMHLQGNSDFTNNAHLYDGSLQIRGRGNSTWRNFPKKSFRLKLEDKSNLLGMGKNRHWILLANYIDESLMRNALALNFSNELGLVTMESNWVDVILNGHYYGNYLLCEKIRVGEDRVNIKDWENIAENIAKAISKTENFSLENKLLLETELKTNLQWVTSGSVKIFEKTYIIKDYYEFDGDITEGYLLELSAEYDEISRFKTSRRAPILIQSPEYAKTNKEMTAYVKNLVQSFEDAIYSEDGYTTYNGNRVHYTELCNIDSLIDYWLVIELFFSADSIWKSRYMYIGSDGLLTFGPVWDFDFSSGARNPWSSIRYDEWRSTVNANNNYWLGALVKQTDFVARVQKRYTEIRQTTIENLVSDGSTIDKWYPYLYESGLANTSLWRYKSGFEKDSKNFKKWLVNRVQWMDIQMESEESLKKSFGISI